MRCLSERCLALAVVFAMLTGAAAGLRASDDDSPKERSKKRQIAIVVRVDGDDVQVETTGLDDQALEKTLSRQIERVIASRSQGAKGDLPKVLERLSGEKVHALGLALGDPDGHAKVEKKVLILHTDDGKDVALPDLPRTLMQLVGPEHEKNLVLQHLESGHARTTHRLGVAIVGTVGLLVGEVVDGSPADQAGLRSGDVLLTVNGEPLEDVGQLVDQVQKAGEKGRSLTLRMLRGDEVTKVEVTPQAVKDDDENDGDHDDDEIEEEEESSPDEQARPQHHEQSRRDRHPEAVEEAIRSAMARVHRDVTDRVEARSRRDAESMRAQGTRQAAAIEQLRAEIRQLREEVRQMKRDRDRD